VTKADQLEAWIFEHCPMGGYLTNALIASDLEIPSWEASQLIQAYLSAQRAAGSKTLYVLHREVGRTRQAVWKVGVRTADARATSSMFFDDVKVKFHRALEPDLKRITMLNPRAGRQCEAIIDAVGDGALKVLQAAVGGIDPDDVG